MSPRSATHSGGNQTGACGVCMMRSLSNGESNSVEGKGEEEERGATKRKPEGRGGGGRRVDTAALLLPTLLAQDLEDALQLGRERLELHLDLLDGQRLHLLGGDLLEDALKKGVRQKR